MSAYAELFMDQGADFSTTIQINNESNNTPQNLSGIVVTSQMRKSLLSQNVTANFVCTPEGYTGVITMTLDSANTSNIEPGTYVYDVKVFDTNALTTTRLIEGIIFVTPQVTY